MPIIKKIALGSLALCALASQGAAETNRPHSRDIAQTPHNLSVTGGGGSHDIKSATETRICIFCHTPHHATSVTPLWSREVSPLSIYVPYQSPTLKSNPQQPRGASRLCLSCHDGTIALGLLAGGKELDPTLKAFRDMPQESDPRKNPNLGLDLSDDHPISFAYPMSLELHDPATLLAQGVRLEQGTYVECISCHDPHSNRNGNFLVKDVSMQHDALCTTCHNKEGWSDADSAHRTGGTRYASVADQVAADGCISCHLPHNAQKGQHLLRLSQSGAGEETNCLLSCHRDVPYSNVWNEFNNSTYSHPVQSFNGVHAADEGLPVAAAKKHVECVDCHNPHRTGYEGYPLGSVSPQLPPASVAPGVNGALRGVRGVDLTGAAPVDVARYEYEVCYRCHAGAGASQFTSLAAQLPLRLFRDYDESNRFNLANPSFHPVTSDRQGTGRSLRTELQANLRRIYCNDCHNSHGANEPHLLRQQNLDSFPLAANSNYPLCFRCHDPDYLLNPLSAPHSGSAEFHRRHVLGPHLNGDTRQAPCSVCHDPHGVPVSRGADSSSGAHLINFDTRYAGAAPVYDAGSRSCSTNCHSTNPRSYDLN